MISQLTYDQIREAVTELWPRVIDPDLFLERLTHAQIVLIVEHCAARASVPQP